MSKEREPILESSLLEEYLLGLTTPEDAARVEHALESNPAVRAEYERMQADVEKFCEAYAEAPPTDLRAFVLQDFEQPTMKVVSDEEETSAPTEEERPIMVPVSQRKPIAWSTAAAALAALIAVSFAVFFYQQNTQLRAELVASQEQQADIARQLAGIQQSLDQQSTLQTVAYHPKTETVLLRGSEKSPGLGVVAYWNRETEQSFLNVLWLPDVPDKCYQLWADVHGEMINLGVLDPTQAPFAPIEFKVDAESLNITLEPKGGSDHPTVSDLVSSIPV